MAKGTINKVMILGRLGANPETRTTQSGTVVANLSLATNDGIGDKITTEWHRVVAFGKVAEIIQKYATKGSQLFIEGRLRTNKWQDKNGNTQYSTEIITTSFQFVGSNNQQETKSDTFAQPSNNFNNTSPQKGTDNMPTADQISTAGFDDDIPF